jgi:hypothetical protein
MRRYEARRWSSSEIPVKAITGGLVALLGVGMLLGQSFQSEATNQIKIEKSVKFK